MNQANALAGQIPTDQGWYSVSLRGDSGCGSQGPIVNAKSGNVSLQYKLPSAVISDLPVVFNYNSLRATFTYHCGLGWRSLFDQYISPVPSDSPPPNGQQYGWDVDLEKSNGTVATYYTVIGTSGESPDPSNSFAYIPSHDCSNALDWDHARLEWRETQPNGTRLFYSLYTYSYSGTGVMVLGYGRLSRIQNRAGAVWTITRDTAGVVTSLRSPFSRVATFSYDGSSSLRRVQDASARITTFSIDGGNRLTQVTSPELCQSNLRYDVNNVLGTWVSPAGDRTTFTYVDAKGELKRLTAPNGAVTTIIRTSTSPGTYTTRMIDPAGRLTTFVFEPDESPINGLGPVSSNVSSPVGESAYSSSFYYPNYTRIGYVADGLGNRTSFTYATYDYHFTDPLVGNPQPSRLRSVQIPDSPRFTYLYDDQYRVNGLIDQTGARSTLIWDGNGNRTGFIDALQRRTSYTYDSNGQVTAVKNPAGEVTTYVYNALGQQTATIDPLGNRTTQTYSPYGQIQRVTNPLNQSTTYLRDLMNRVTAEIDPQGNRTSFTYDLNGRRYKVKDALGQITTTIYDAMGRKTAEVNPLGNRTSYAYDRVGNQNRMQDGTGAITTFVYDAGDRRVATINPLSQRTTSVYDIASNLIAIVDPLLHRVTTVYDSARHVLANIDSLGNRTTYAYDVTGRRIRTVDAQLGIATTSYNAAGEVRYQSDPLGYRTTFAYDMAGRPRRAQNALGSIATTVYDKAGHVVANIDPFLNRTTYGYDSAGRQNRSITPLGTITTILFDSDGRPTVAIDPLLHRNTFVYDKVGRQTAVVNGLGKRSTTTYDAAGQSVGSIDPLLNRTTYTYDKAGRPIVTLDAQLNRWTTVYDVAGRQIAQIDGNAHRTSFVYDTAGRRTALLDANSHRTTFGYDANNQAILQQDPLLRRTTYGYDSLHRLAKRVDARGVVTTYGYDANSRQTMRKYSDGTRVTQVYDPVGNRIGMQDSSGRTTFAYDAISRRTLSRDRTNNRLSYTYDAASQLKSLRSSAGVFTYSFDAAGRLAGFSNPRTTWVYDAANQLLQKYSTNSTRISYSYDDAGRVSHFTHFSPSSFFNSYTNSYDKVGNRTETIDAGGSLTVYTYDHAYQLAQDAPALGWSDLSLDQWANMTINGWANTVLASSSNIYRYDAVGNRIGMTSSSGALTTYTYDAANQMTRILSGGVPYTFTYDASGNPLTQRNTGGPFNITMTWDAESRLSSYFQSGIASGNSFSQRLTHTYNGDNLRVERLGGPSDARYVWDNQNVHLKLTTGNVLVDSYLYEPNEYGLLIASGSSQLYPLTINLGSTTGLTNASGTFVDSYTYTSWGEFTPNKFNTHTFPFLFVGQTGYYTDDEGRASSATSPLLPLYVRGRFYQPRWGRWLNQDPLRYASDDWNFYRYVFGDPIGRTDPSGLQTREDTRTFGGCPPPPPPCVPRPPEPFNPNTDWCGGRDPATRYVPESFGRAYFGRCCNSHDNCYGACEPKLSCDQAFYNCLVDACGAAYPVTSENYSVCRSRAFTYFISVYFLGIFFYGR